MRPDEVEDLPAFHAGEVSIQESVGVAEKMAPIGEAVMRRHLPEQHRAFFAQLTYLVVGVLGADQQPWASFLTGPAGFVSSPRVDALKVAAQPLPGDPACADLDQGSPVALLGLEAHTRRRNRANGVIEARDESGFTLRVRESFGNCPKYIQARQASPGGIAFPSSIDRSANLDATARQLIERADTFFIATAHPEAGRNTRYGVDVSHRGGKPGFIRIERDETGHDMLLVPDFAGNSFFNTLGNIVLNPRVGLLFIDYAGQGLLHLAGEARLILDAVALGVFAGAERLLAISIHSTVLRRSVLPLVWTEAEPSPFLHNTGKW